ncbi:MAG: caspase family protein [Verrucomicrobiales bacterium]|nr:caspase family protein [Verrucomicrobiales bacterium]
MKVFHCFCRGVLACLTFGLISWNSSAADRVALVIGIDRYDHLPRQSQLDVAVKDANLMANTLKGLNPPFVVQLLTDVQQRDAMESLTRFVENADGAECALVYFAGHGVEYHGSNFLLARDTNVSKVSPDVDRMKRRLRLAALPLQTIVDELDGTGAQVKVVILDACRDNPLLIDDGTGTRSVFGRPRGLAQVTPPSGTLIAYSADAGQQANDGLFTGVLAKNLQTPGLPLLEVFAATREEVVRRSTELATRNQGVRHEPAEYTKLNRAGTRFSFVAGSGASPASGEVEKLRAQIASLTKQVEELEANGQRVDELKTQLAAMEATQKESSVESTGTMVKITSGSVLASKINGVTNEETVMKIGDTGKTNDPAHSSGLPAMIGSEDNRFRIWHLANGDIVNARLAVSDKGGLVVTLQTTDGQFKSFFSYQLSSEDQRIIEAIENYRRKGK